MIKIIKEAYFDKEVYERKNAWAAKHQVQNARITTLTPEQHEVLSRLCSLRHDLHSMSEDKIFNDDSQESKEFWGYVDTFNYDPPALTTMLTEVGLPPLDWEADITDYDTSDFFNDYEVIADDGTVYPADLDIDDDLYWEKRSVCVWRLGELKEQFNRAIENYLRKIDDKQGTEYAPTGKSRIF